MKNPEYLCGYCGLCVDCNNDPCVCPEPGTAPPPIRIECYKNAHRLCLDKREYDLFGDDKQRQKEIYLRAVKLYRKRYT